MIKPGMKNATLKGNTCHTLDDRITAAAMDSATESIRPSVKK
jgi:hypothetical protein